MSQNNKKRMLQEMPYIPRENRDEIEKFKEEFNKRLDECPYKAHIWLNVQMEKSNLRLANLAVANTMSKTKPNTDTPEPTPPDKDDGK